MPEQVVKQRTRGFICVNAHPEGCARNVEQQAEHIRRARPEGLRGPRSVLVIGSSTGYGLASRAAAAWGFGASTIGVFLERPPQGRRTATAGYYNSAAFQRLARRDGLHSAEVNGDAFSDEVKKETFEKVRSGPGKLDLVVYSLASPRRKNPRDGRSYDSCLKPIGAPYRNKSIDLDSGRITEASIEPASQEEIDATVAVMGGEDWRWWIEGLLDEGLLNEGARTLAYSYVGPELTWPIYRDGTVGAAKKDLASAARDLDQLLSEKLGGQAAISVNKAVVTQASAAIPVLPLYVSLLFGVMKRKGLHEGCIEQMRRLFFDYLAENAGGRPDPEGLIRLDDLELRADVQEEVARLWEQVTADNLNELADFAGFRRDFNNLFGFEVEGVDYGKPVETGQVLE